MTVERCERNGAELGDIGHSGLVGSDYGAGGFDMALVRNPIVLVAVHQRDRNCLGHALNILIGHRYLRCGCGAALRSK
jgi:hypothetical protein